MNVNTSGRGARHLAATAATAAVAALASIGMAACATDTDTAADVTTSTSAASPAQRAEDSSGASEERLRPAMTVEVWELAMCRWSFEFQLDAVPEWVARAETLQDGGDDAMDLFLGAIGDIARSAVEQFTELGPAPVPDSGDAHAALLAAFEAIADGADALRTSRDQLGSYDAVAEMEEFKMIAATEPFIAPIVGLGEAELERRLSAFGYSDDPNAAPPTEPLKALFTGEGCSVHAGVVEPRIAEWERLDGICRGASSVAAKEEACHQQDALYAEVNEAGWCYGYTVDGDPSDGWHVCLPDRSDDPY